MRIPTIPPTAEPCSVRPSGSGSRTPWTGRSSAWSPSAICGHPAPCRKSAFSPRAPGAVSVPNPAPSSHSAGDERGRTGCGNSYIDANIQPCTVCPDMPCVKACPTGALTLPSEGWTGYRLATLELIAERCVTFKGQTVPGVCRRVPGRESALAMDEDGHPVIKVEGCVGCGSASGRASRRPRHISSLHWRPDGRSAVPR